MNLQIQCFLYNLVNVYRISLNKRYSKLKGQSRMDNPEKTEGAIKNGQCRENQRSQSRMDNPQKTEGAIKNGQSRNTGIISEARHRTETNKT
jgi:hypothetical protein